MAMTNLEKLQAWVIERQRTHGLQEIAFTPGSSRELSIEDAAGVALELLKGYDTGTDATEK